MSAILLCSGEIDPWAKKTPIQRKTEKSLKNLQSIGVNLDLKASGIDLNNLKSQKSLKHFEKVNSYIKSSHTLSAMDTANNINFDRKFSYEP